MDAYQILESGGTIALAKKIAARLAVTNFDDIDDWLFEVADEIEPGTTVEELADDYASGQGEYDYDGEEWE